MISKSLRELLEYWTSTLIISYCFLQQNMLEHSAEHVQLLLQYIQLYQHQSYL